MSVTNPERIVTKQDLSDFYEGIFPYLGGNAEAGFTPIGTIIAVMGNSAPTNYLACNGQVVNIADYPELANYFLAQFGSRNYFGGDGTTTFAICDLRGEFLRGTGTNGHSNQGNGAAVGTHQDATQIMDSYIWNSSYATGLTTTASGLRNSNENVDVRTQSSGVSKHMEYTNGTLMNDDARVWFSARPTNTSVLYCIATKNIYLNPAMDYTETEKVVGSWIDGKALYQRVIQCGQIPSNTSKIVDTYIPDTVELITMSFYISAGTVLYPVVNLATSDGVRAFSQKNSGTVKITIMTSADYSAYSKSWAILQYTKP